LISKLRIILINDELNELLTASLLQEVHLILIVSPEDVGDAKDQVEERLRVIISEELEKIHQALEEFKRQRLHNEVIIHS
jgi:hypothetical protein